MMVNGMKTVALLTEKGGTGKSTLAVHLAVCAGRQGKTVAAIDLDPQASAASWCERRAGGDIAVVAAKVQELPRLLAEARKATLANKCVSTPTKLPFKT